ncbi:hypothetical protein [Polaribacter marinivivus]|uniref:Uncharacterized protein n=1 Tax=Polaribacter marinivivus TaxID=1524260 RepID=A0ABV8R584_9FLAO
MNSDIVYQVAKALPMEEQLLLFEKLKNDFKRLESNTKKANFEFKKSDAIHYLLTNIFNKK